MEKLELQQFAGEIVGLLTKGTVLSYKKLAEFVELAGVKGIPQLGGDPERVDVTTLADAKRKYIAGIEDTDNLEFAIVYQTANFTDVHTLVETGVETEFKVVYPDGMAVTFKGVPKFKFSAAEINGALEFTLVIVVSDGPDFVPVV